MNYAAVSVNMEKIITCEGDVLKRKKQSAAEKAIREIAQREGITTEYVRKQIQVAMLNGLCSTNPRVKAFWDSIPRNKEVPTPEELIIYISEMVKRKGSI